MEFICATLKSNDEPVIIKEVNNKIAVIGLDYKSRITVSHKDMTMMVLKKKNMVLVIGRGRT